MVIVKFSSVGTLCERVEPSGFVASGCGNSCLWFIPSHCKCGQFGLTTPKRCWLLQLQHFAFVYHAFSFGSVVSGNSTAHQEKRDAEAEKLARASVRVLENGERHAFLAELLTTHATALARLGQYGAALATFRRALDLCQRIGSHDHASEVAFTVFQEMGERLAVVEEQLTITGRKLSDEVRALEYKLIKHAL